MNNRVSPRAAVVLFGLLIACPAFAQASHPKPTVTALHATYGAIVTLQLHRPVHFDDGTSLELTTFSHKHAMTGGPTKATAYVTLTRGKVTHSLMLSVHGTGDGPDVTYDSLRWEAYAFELKGFAYDQLIEVVVTQPK